MSKGGEEMKIVNLCSHGSCCPVVKITDDHIEIGEEGNLCVLTSEEWETLKNKILKREMQVDSTFLDKSVYSSLTTEMCK